MGADLHKPFLTWANDSIEFRPDVSRSGWREVRAREATEHIAGSGRANTWYVGPRRFFEVTFEWQTDTQLETWWTWWDAVKDGSPFTYYHDESYYRAGDGITCGDDIVCGYLQTADTDITNNPQTVIVAMDEFSPAQADVDTYWHVTIRLRAQ